MTRERERERERESERERERKRGIGIQLSNQMTYTCKITFFKEWEIDKSEHQVKNILVLDYSHLLSFK